MMWMLELEMSVKDKTEKTVETYATLEAAMVDFKSAKNRFKALQGISNLTVKATLIETDDKFTEEKVIAAYNS